MSCETSVKHSHSPAVTEGLRNEAHTAPKFPTSKPKSIVRIPAIGHTISYFIMQEAAHFYKGRLGHAQRDRYLQCLEAYRRYVNV